MGRRPYYYTSRITRNKTLVGAYEGEMANEGRLAVRRSRSDGSLRSNLHRFIIVK